MFQAQPPLSSTYYDILGISQNSSINDIKKAYKELVLKYHPDKTTVERETALEKFKELNQAYAILTNDDKRIIYDLYEKNKSCIQQIPTLNPNIFNIILQLIEDESDSDFSDNENKSNFQNKEELSQSPRLYGENQEHFLNSNLRKINEKIGFQMSSNIRMFSQYIIDLLDSCSEDESQGMMNNKKLFKQKQGPCFEDKFMNLLEPSRGKKPPLLTKQNIRIQQNKNEQKNVLKNIRNKKDVFTILKKPINKPKFLLN